MSIVAVLLLGASAVTGYFWWRTASDLEQTRTDLSAEIAQLNGTVDAQESQLDSLDAELSRLQDALAEAETELLGTENLVDELEEGQATIRECFLLIDEILALEDSGDPIPADLRDEADETCAQVDRILGF